MKIKTKPCFKSSLSIETAVFGISTDREYFVIGIDNECYRIINDLNEPILYPKDIFLEVELAMPVHWVRRDYEDGEYYIDPPEFSSPGFFEDFFDVSPEAIKVFNRHLKLNGMA